jgi:spore germination protein YaaH
VSKHTGGGKFGKVQNSWPFVTLTISDDGISMKTILQEVKMKRTSIQAIILQKNFISYRFIFKHNDPVIAKEMEFWTFSPDPVANALKSQGYSVSIGT